MSKGNKKQKNFEEFQKCGEIFYHNGCFKISCTDCVEILFDVIEFLDHFKKKHCTQKDNFIGNEDTHYFSSPAKHHASNFGSFETITLLSLDSSNDINNFSTDEETDAIASDRVPEIDSISNGDDGAGKNKVAALHLRKKHKCGKCGEKFVSIKSLKMHIKRRHYEKEQYNCNQCTETFDKKSSLWKHERDVHIILACKICKKEFKKQRGLKDHMALHDTRIFQCDYEGCTKTFKLKRRLSEHKNTHFSKQSYVCEICGYYTVRKHGLVAHVRTHTGEKPYPCKICGKHFISASMVKEHSATHATERRHVCDVCGATFARPKALYHHKPLHLGIKKFVCSVCDRSFAQAAGLSAHMRKHKVNGKIVLGLEGT